jgi:lipid-binding SYLF domain-containing protein
MTRFALFVLALAGALVSGPTSAQILQNLEDKVMGKPGPEQIAAAREEVRDAAQAALSALYALQPEARRAVERAAGYAAFSTIGMKLLIAGGTTGKGIAVDHRTGARTYMRMTQVQGGLGFGVSKNQVIFVFTAPKALADFIAQGWEFGAQANVSAVAKGEGGMFTGAAALAPNVYVYQITETGLNAELTVAGTRFYVDQDLN